MKIQKTFEKGKSVLSLIGLPHEHKLVALGSIGAGTYFAITANKDNCSFYNNYNVRLGKIGECMRSTEVRGVEKEKFNAHFKVKTDEGEFVFALNANGTISGCTHTFDGIPITCQEFHLPNGSSPD